MSDIIQQVVTEAATAEKWAKYFIQKNTELETEYTNLLDGQKDRLGRGYRKAGYSILRDFFDGDQWKYVPEGGKPMRVYNYCRLVVNNYTSFLSNEPVDVDVIATDITDETEVSRAEAKEKVLRDIMADNLFDYQFECAVQNGSLLGDSILVGPFYNDEEDRIWFKNVKKPENVRLIWKDANYDELFGFIHHYHVSLETAYTMFGDKFKAKGIVPSESYPALDRGSAFNQTGRKMTEVLDCWTDKIHLLLVGNKVVDFEEHDYGFVPCIHVPNLVHPEEPFGTSDIEDLLDPQTEYNEKSSDISEVISQTAFPWIFGSNLRPAEIKSGVLNLVDLGEEAVLHNDPRAFRSGDLNNEISRRLSNFYQISGLNENIFGGTGVRAVTGRALSVLMQTVNNRVKSRQTRWTIALKQLFRNIFILVEKKTEGGRDLIGGFYETDLFFPGTLMRNVTDEINKFNAKLQSQETTMKNLGVPSPKDEKKLMKREIEDMLLMVELSRNPQLQLQVRQMQEQEAAQNLAGQKPMLQEDQNQGDEMPMAQGGMQQQSAISAKGAVAQAGQRSTNTSQITSSE